MVIDASVLVDIWVKSRKRHSLAVQLATKIKEMNLRITIPMHALIEVVCAVNNEKSQKSEMQLNLDIFTKESPMQIEIIPLDNDFLKNYMDSGIPFYRSGDLPYILIAKKHGYPLITEDNNQYKLSKKSGIETFKISEFLKRNT